MKKMNLYFVIIFLTISTFSCSAETTDSDIKDKEIKTDPFTKEEITEPEPEPEPEPQDKKKKESFVDKLEKKYEGKSFEENFYESLDKLNDIGQ